MMRERDRLALHLLLSLTPFQVFDANSDPYNVAEVTLDVSGILTRFVRIYPINCVRAGVPSDCLMRFEILGCLI